MAVPRQSRQGTPLDGGRQRTRRTPDERRAQLIGAARDLIFGKGLATTSVSDIVRAAGVAQGTFYLYFQSKDEIVNAVAQEWGDRWFEEALRIVESPDADGLEKLLGMFAARALTDVSILEQVDFYRHVHRLENRPFHDELARVQSRRIAPLAETAIREGVEQGLFTTPSPAEAALWIVAAVVGAEMLLDPADPDYDASRWASSYVDFILRALGCTVPQERVDELIRRLSTRSS